MSIKNSRNRNYAFKKRLIPTIELHNKENTPKTKEYLPNPNKNKHLIELILGDR